MKLETHAWAEERERVEKRLSARGQSFIRWNWKPTVDHFVWRRPGENFPEIGDA